MTRMNCLPTPRTSGLPVPDDVDRLVETILEACSETPGEVYLFGSGAREELTATSDLDLGILSECRARNAETDRIARALPRKRAVDVVVTDSLEMTSEATDRTSWARGAIREGIVLFRDGRRRPYRTARLRPDRPSPPLPVDDDEPGDVVDDKVSDSRKDIEWAMLHAGRKGAAKDGLPGPAERHRVRWLAARSAWLALCAQVLRTGRWPDHKAGLADLQEALPDGDPARTVPPDTLARLEAHRRKWRFQGEAAPAMDEALHAVEDANTVLDHLPETAGERETRRRLQTRLAARRSGFRSDPGR